MFFRNYFENEKKQYYKFLVRKINRSIWDMELRIITIKEIREGMRKEFDKLAEVIKGIEDEVTKLKGEKILDVPKIEKLTKTKAKYDIDAEQLKEQMIGKWSDPENEYIGGIDQETKAIVKKIEGGEEFRNLIQRESKKL